MDIMEQKYKMGYITAKDSRNRNFYDITHDLYLLSHIGLPVNEEGKRLVLGVVQIPEQNPINYSESKIVGDLSIFKSSDSFDSLLKNIVEGGLIGKNFELFIATETTTTNTAGQTHRELQNILDVGYGKIEQTAVEGTEYSRYVGPIQTFTRTTKMLAPSMGYVMDETNLLDRDQFQIQETRKSFEGLTPEWEQNKENESSSDEHEIANDDAQNNDDPIND